MTDEVFERLRARLTATGTAADELALLDTLRTSRADAARLTKEFDVCEQSLTIKTAQLGDAYGEIARLTKERDAERHACAAVKESSVLIAEECLRLRKALAYVIEVRRITCSHPPLPNDEPDPICAACTARAALAPKEEHDG